MENLGTYIHEGLISEGLLTGPLGDMEKEGWQMLHEKELKEYIASYGDLYLSGKAFDKCIEFIDENTINFGHKDASDVVSMNFRIHGDHVSPKYRQPSWLRINKFSGELKAFFKSPSITPPECWPSSFYDLTNIEFVLGPLVRSFKGFKMDFNRPDRPVYISLLNNSTIGIDIPELDIEISGKARRVNIDLGGNLRDWKILKGIKNRSGIPGTIRILEESGCWGEELRKVLAIMDNYITADMNRYVICDTLNKNIPNWITSVELAQYAPDKIHIKNKIIDVRGSSRLLAFDRKGGRKGAEFQLSY